MRREHTTETEVSVSEAIEVVDMPALTEFVPTGLGRLHVARTGAGPPVMLWHSLFVDSRSWGPLVSILARTRTVYAIDGPSHGRSDPVTRDFTIEECVVAAEQVLDCLGLSAPVDWVGNAWGGHVGIRLAAKANPRVRTLTTIGTPVRGFTIAEKWTKGWPLVWLYRLAGANGIVTGQLSDALLGSEAVRAAPELAATVLASFAEAARDGMVHAVRSMMMHRNGIAELLGDVAVPTLVMSARDDAMGWRPEEARRTCAAIADCRVEVVAGGGHVAPLLIDGDRIAALLEAFWAAAEYRP
jgi:pimeloyl-ACP methyl ester carboxylesterase